MTFLPMTVIAIALRPALAVSALGGAWLAISPWILGYAHLGTAAWLNDLLAGALLIAWAARTATTDDEPHPTRGPPRSTVPPNEPTRPSEHAPGLRRR